MNKTKANFYIATLCNYHKLTLFFNTIIITISNKITFYPFLSIAHLGNFASVFLMRESLKNKRIRRHLIRNFQLLRGDKF